MSLRLTRLALTDFRNYHSLVWHPGRLNVLSGPNGSGKTNLLEAVSLLVPGRGLRGARNLDLARRDAGTEARWAVAARFATETGRLDVGTGTAPDGPSDRRAFRLDGTAPRSQAEIARQVAAVWLTPQMDRLFQEAASGRRRFLDRLVWALEPAHAGEAAAHETALASRNRLLAQSGRDSDWLAGIEDAIARHAVAVTAARVSLAARLNAGLAAGVADPFPPARLALLCPIAERLAGGTALAVEDWLRETLAADRARDAAAGAASVGAHRADLAVTDAASGLSASAASTGQRKAMLVGLILGHAALIAEARGFAPLLLLDEPAVHLDLDRRRALFQALAALPGQALLTGTDAETFEPLRDAAAGWRVRGGELTVDSAFPPLPPVPETL